jgi:PTH1 family peptidyl-tRNA hydrolase
MKIILGLGNPGRRYEDTRHNIGFMVIDAFAEKLRVRFPVDPEDEPGAWVTESRLGSERLLLVKPATFMNRSGLAGRRLMEKFQAPEENIIVVYDDADLPFGTIRIRPHGGAGGHRGVESIRTELGNDSFPRVRLGVLGEERGETELADYVLSRFDRSERERLPDIVTRTVGALETWVTEGTSAAMNRYNGPEGSGPGKDSAQADRPVQR